MRKTTRNAARKCACDRNVIEKKHMDTKVQPTPTHENGAKVEESSSDPPEEISNGKEEIPKDVPKALKITRQTRSRSRTPQKSKEKKPDEKIKSKKEESKTLSPKNSEQNMNGHNEKKLESPKTEDTKNNDKDEKITKQDSSRRTRSSENAVILEEKTDSSKTKEHLNTDVTNKDTLKSEENKSEPVSKKHDKKNSLEPSTSSEDSKTKNSRENSSLSSEIPSKDNLSKTEGEAVDMDPLVLATDEFDPELQFNENSDIESGKGSPIQLRCKTRRSHTRNIPTPKTPKPTDSESEKNSIPPTPTPENLNDTNDSISIGDSSTRVEVGSDVTRLNYIADNSTFVSDEHLNYLNYSRDKSMSETLRSLSPRKTFRPINDSYRQRAFRNNQNKSDLNIPFSEADCATGIKRKRSSSPEDRKKFKGDTTGFVSYLSSPIANFKNRFMTNANCSTPKLTGYKDSRKNIHGDVSYTEVVLETPEKKNWCSVM